MAYRGRARPAHAADRVGSAAAAAVVVVVVVVGEVSPGGDIADHGRHMVLEEESPRSRLRAAAG
ncbi:hypothetical protein [Nocardia sp. NPDC004604]|uniref:hypothetical protein n=1 Tax=Nocardia sp. NPDC004604 TaxID=3157013 RepID=UPI0033AB2D6C